MTVEALYEAGAHEDALATAEALLALHPDNAALYLLRGALLSDLGDPYAAAEDFRRVTELIPGEGDGWGWLGRELIRAGDLAEARLATEKALLLDPNDADDWTFNLGHIALLEGDRDVAHCRYREAVARILSQSGLKQALAGFDNLIASGWQEETLTAERDWVRRAFDALSRYEATQAGGAQSSGVRQRLLRGESIEGLAGLSAVDARLAGALRVLDMDADAAVNEMADEDAAADDATLLRLPARLLPEVTEAEAQR